MLDRIENSLEKVVSLTVVIIFSVMVILVFGQVVARAIKYPFTWSEELARFSMIWMVFLASSIAYKKKSHILVENLVNILPPIIAKPVKILALVLQVAFIVIILFGAYKVLPFTFMQKSPSNSITMAYVYVSLPISAVLMLLTAVKNLINTIKFKERSSSE